MKTVLVTGLLVLGLAQPAWSFGWSEVADTGTKAVKVSGTVLVWADKALEWSWYQLHNRAVHPLVKVLTLGIVDLDNPN